MLGHNGSKETGRFAARQITVADCIMTLPLVSKASVFPVHAMMVYGGSKSIAPLILFLSTICK